MPKINLLNKRIFDKSEIENIKVMYSRQWLDITEIARIMKTSVWMINKVLKSEKVPERRFK